MRGSARVMPRSARTIAGQFVATYLGRYSSPPDVPGVTQCPSGHWFSRSDAAQPTRPIALTAARTRGSCGARPSASSQNRARTLGSDFGPVSHFRIRGEMRICRPKSARPHKCSPSQRIGPNRGSRRAKVPGLTPSEVAVIRPSIVEDRNGPGGIRHLSISGRHCPTDQRTN